MVAQLKTVPNEARCAFSESVHELRFNDMCPISHNPQLGSSLSIHYKANGHFLEVASLRTFIDSYQGGQGDIRSMEGMLQHVAQSASDTLRVNVKLTSRLVIEPDQVILLTCFAFPKIDN